MIQYFILTILVFFANWKSLGLTLYADDWIVIVKFFYTFGPGKYFPYWRIDTWFADYGFQNLMAIAWLIFKENSIYYYILNLLTKSLAATSLYFLIKRAFNQKIAWAAAFFFCVFNIGTETTDWVYNFNTYIGIAIALRGIDFYLFSSGISRIVFGWGLMLLGYGVVPIRLYVIPVLLPIAELIRSVHMKLPVKQIIALSLAATLSIVAMKHTFPFLGAINKPAIIGGWKSAQVFMETGRWDFWLYPFTNLGKMVLPVGPTELGDLGWAVRPISKYILYGGGMVLVGAYVLFRSKINLFLSLSLAIGISIALKIFIKYQGDWGLNNFSYFFWTYLGIIITVVLLHQLWKHYKSNNTNLLLLFIFTSASIFTFILPQQNNPSFIFESFHRYLAFPAIGISILLSVVIFRSKTLLSTAVLTLVVGSHFIASNSYFDRLLVARSPEKNTLLFAEIRRLVPELPNDLPTVFYFEYPEPQVYYNLLYSSFGYHMQLLYGQKLDESLVASSVRTIPDLVSTVETRKIPIDHVYALSWKNNQFVDISSQIRAQVTDMLQKDH